MSVACVRAASSVSECHVQRPPVLLPPPPPPPSTRPPVCGVDQQFKVTGGATVAQKFKIHLPPTGTSGHPTLHCVRHFHHDWVQSSFQLRLPDPFARDSNGGLYLSYVRWYVYVYLLLPFVFFLHNLQYLLHYL